MAESKKSAATGQTTRQLLDARLRKLRKTGTQLPTLMYDASGGGSYGVTMPKLTLDQVSRILDVLTPKQLQFMLAEAEEQLIDLGQLPENERSSTTLQVPHRFAKPPAAFFGFCI